MREDLAFVFPGQGAQAVGMMRALAAEFPQVRARYRQASTILGYDLWALVDCGPEDRLNQTACTQPALLTASVATWDIWRECGGPLPRFGAGHSFGEYSALVCGGALRFEDAVSLVADRGRFMQRSVPAGEGAMAAVLGLDASAVRALCEAAADGGTVECANFNAPDQTVIAGDAAAVTRAVSLATERGAKRVIRLVVSVPAHCALMAPAALDLAERIDGVDIRRPEFAVVQNVDVCAHMDPPEIRAALVRQLTSPVRWSETIEYFAGAGIATVIECGPAKVLSGLVKRTAKTLECFSLSTGDGIRAALRHVGG